MSYGSAPPPSSGKATASLILGIASFFVCITGIPAAILGALALGDIRRNPMGVGGRGMAIAGICTGIGGTALSMLFLMLALLLPAVQAARMAAQRAQAINNMKQIGLAMHNFESQKKQLPIDIEDKDGKPLLSWRVAILPYIEQQSLYNQFRLNEPWDSPHNLALAKTMPQIYQSPRIQPEPPGQPGKTVYFRPKGAETMFFMQNGKQVPVRFSMIKDGLSNTIMTVEADEDQAVVWTKPQDLDVDLSNPRRGLTGNYGRGRFLIGLGDGSVFLISEKARDETLKKALTRAGMEPVDTNELLDSSRR